MIEGTTKYILREAMKGVVPKEILERKRKDKIGFSTPETEWIKGLKNNVETYLETLKEIDFIDHEYFFKLINEVIEGKKKYQIL